MFSRSQIQRSLRRPDERISRHEQVNALVARCCHGPVHLDGYNNLNHWTGKSEKSARGGTMLYDENDLVAV
jgi:hypothetical protein